MDTFIKNQITINDGTNLYEVIKVIVWQYSFIDAALE